MKVHIEVGKGIQCDGTVSYTHLDRTQLKGIEAFIELQEDENGRKRKSIEKFYRDGD